MMIERREGRTLFGANAAAYEAARPRYPRALYDVLANQGALVPGTGVLEIGPASGVATRDLIARGARPITLVEPDRRFEQQLLALRALTDPVHLRFEAFEDVDLGDQCFDLACAATSFHWLDQKTRAIKIGQHLRRGGYCGLWWNIFQQLGVDDPFHNATAHLLADLPSYSEQGHAGKIPSALRRDERLAEFATTQMFEIPLVHEWRWTLRLDPWTVRNLYEGFSPMRKLGDNQRQRLLDQLVEIAVQEFNGEVARNMTTILYLARRR